MARPHRGIMSTHLRWLQEAATHLEQAQSKLGDVFEKTPQPWVSERVSVVMERLSDIESYLASNLIGALEGNPRTRRTKRRTRLIREVQFFRSHAGGVVGEATKGALELARAERYAEQRGWTVEWHDDPDADWSWLDQPGFEKEKAKDHEVYYAVLKDRDGEVLASLGGIFDPDQKYMRVIAAELALEASDRASRRRAR